MEESHGATSKGHLGFDPFDVFDLWQRNLNRTMTALERDPAQCSEVRGNPTAASSSHLTLRCEMMVPLCV